MIKKFLGKDSVFLLQNMFPTIEKYVDHVHIVNGKEAKVISRIAKEIEIKFKKLLILINQGKKVIFTDVEKDVRIMLDELKNDRY